MTPTTRQQMEEQGWTMVAQSLTESTWSSPFNSNVERTIKES